MTSVGLTLGRHRRLMNQEPALSVMVGSFGPVRFLGDPEFCTDWRGPISLRRLRRLYDSYRQVSHNKTIFRRAALTMLARAHSQGRPLAASISVRRCRPLPPLVRNDPKPRCSPVRQHCYDRCYGIPTHRLYIVHGYPEPITVKYTGRVPSHSKPCFR
jgi:hypothetical protein